MSSTVLVIILFCTFHVSNNWRAESDDIQESIKRITPKLEEVEENLRQLKITISKNVLEILVNLHKSFGESGSVIATELKDLEFMNMILKQRYNNKGGEIIKCLNAQSVALENIMASTYVDLHSNYETNSEIIKHLSNKAQNIAQRADAIGKSLKRVIGMCISRSNLPWRTDSVYQCLVNETLLIGNVVDELRHNFSVILVKSLDSISTRPPCSILESISSLKRMSYSCIFLATHFHGDGDEDVSIIDIFNKPKDGILSILIAIRKIMNGIEE
ncbi:hypothetical protein RI129_007887 [Pyrocoelia pectoralis]|uniref:Uncharacterized protein n=1 Tax=Pyrocoelia pectoralis TaxID=417401 RepID=A0AAN7ZHE5_9COLE